MNQVKSISPLEQMIQQQIVERGISDPRVIEAIRSVPRERFFPEKSRDTAYVGRAASIGHGQTISEPYIVALMTHRLDVRHGSKVLEIGTGSGYQTGVLAKLAGQVYTIERIKALLDEAWERLMDLNLRNIHFRHGDGTLGWPSEAPFDRILIAAGAPRLPRTLLLSNLTDGGIAVLPVGPDDEQTLVQVTRRGHELSTVDICRCRFVKLIGREAWDGAQ